MKIEGYSKKGVALNLLYILCNTNEDSIKKIFMKHIKSIVLT